MIYNRAQILSDADKRKNERKPKGKIKPLSDKRQAQQKVYVGMVKYAVAKDPTCHVKSPVCNNTMSGFQHLVKRSSKNLCDPDNLIQCCSPCQLWIEENPLQAIAMGVSKSKFLKR